MFLNYSELHHTTLSYTIPTIWDSIMKVMYRAPHPWSYFICILLFIDVPQHGKKVLILEKLFWSIFSSKMRFGHFLKSMKFLHIETHVSQTSLNEIKLNLASCLSIPSSIFSWSTISISLSHFMLWHHLINIIWKMAYL